MTVKENINIAKCEPLLSPLELKKELPLSEAGADRVMNNRQAIQSILEHKDDRKMVIVGPCSIHAPNEAIEYAKKLKELSDKVADKLLVIMRVYFEKPRTTVGWKGLIYDPYLDESYKIGEGLKIARKLLLDIDELGLATATEALDPVTTQYIADLISWAAIGARTTESQTHRQLVSGMSMPVGFKNTTDGSIKVAIDAICSSMHPHAFLGVLDSGLSGIFHTKGNKYAHMVLRGGSNGPNYGAEHIAFSRELMKKASLTPNLVVDCSHANSDKKADNQAKVLNDLVHQINNGEESIVGVMIESNLKHGNQKVKDIASIKPGVSITDECIGWEETEQLILNMYSSLK